MKLSSDWVNACDSEYIAVNKSAWIYVHPSLFLFCSICRVAKEMKINAARQREPLTCDVTQSVWIELAAGNKLACHGENLLYFWVPWKKLSCNPSLVWLSQGDWEEVFFSHLINECHWLCNKRGALWEAGGTLETTMCGWVTGNERGAYGGDSLFCDQWWDRALKSIYCLSMP